MKITAKYQWNREHIVALLVEHCYLTKAQAKHYYWSFSTYPPTQIEVKTAYPDDVKKLLEEHLNDAFYPYTNFSIVEE